MKKERIFVTLAAAGAAAILLGSSLSGADTKKLKPYKPVAPEGDYFILKHLMGDGMMPNYKALWYAFRTGDDADTKQALANISALSRQALLYPPPGKETTEGDFAKRLAELRQKADALRGDVGPALDRSAASGRILSIYQTCQSCHESYAPKEGADRRKYTPPL